MWWLRAQRVDSHNLIECYIHTFTVVDFFHRVRSSNIVISLLYCSQYFTLLQQCLDCIYTIYILIKVWMFCFVMPHSISKILRFVSYQSTVLYYQSTVQQSTVHVARKLVGSLFARATVAQKSEEESEDENIQHLTHLCSTFLIKTINSYFFVARAPQNREATTPFFNFKFYSLNAPAPLFSSSFFFFTSMTRRISEGNYSTELHTVASKKVYHFIRTNNYRLNRIELN